MRNNFSIVFLRFIFLAVSIVVWNKQLYARSGDSAASKYKWNGNISLSESYNDNILDYSSRDIDSLEHGATEIAQSKFSISDASDYLTTLKAKGSLSALWFKRNPTSLSIRLTNNFYGSSHIKNNSSWEVSAKQVFKRKNYVVVSAQANPNIYLRNLKFRRPKKTIDQKYIEVFVHKNEYSIELGRVFSTTTTCAVQYSYSIADYTQQFNERNNRSNNYTFELSTKIFSGVTFNGAYSFSHTNANGSTAFPDSVRVGGVTKYKYRDDISNSAQRIEIGFDYTLRHHFHIPLKWNIDFINETQKYVTAQPLNKYYSRKDSYAKIVTGFTYRLQKNYEVFLQYYWEQNSTNQKSESDFGSFHTHQIKLGFEYSLN